MSMHAPIYAAIAVTGDTLSCWSEGADPARRAFSTPDGLLLQLLPVLDAVLASLPPEERAPAGIILGSKTGCLLADIDFDESRRPSALFASPAAFARTLPSTPAAEISVKLALHGPVLMVTHGVLSRALSWMRHTRAPVMIAGWMEQTERHAWFVVLREGSAPVAFEHDALPPELLRLMSPCL